LGTNFSTKIWNFGNNGSLTFPDNSVQTTAYTGFGNANVAAYLAGNIQTGNVTVTGSIAYIMGNYHNWTSNVNTISSALDQLAARLKAAGF
jgi:hypothetical protein